MRYLLLIAIAALAGCSTTGQQIYKGGLIGQKVIGNEAYVSVSNVWNEMDAMPLADKHCHQFGKVARFTHMKGYRAIYDCVHE